MFRLINLSISMFLTASVYVCVFSKHLKACTYTHVFVLCLLWLLFIVCVCLSGRKVPGRHYGISLTLIWEEIVWSLQTSQHVSFAGWPGGNTHRNHTPHRHPLKKTHTAKTLHIKPNKKKKQHTLKLNLCPMIYTTCPQNIHATTERCIDLMQQNTL